MNLDIQKFNESYKAKLLEISEQLKTMNSEISNILELGFVRNPFEKLEKEDQEGLIKINNWANLIRIFIENLCNDEIYSSVTAFITKHKTRITLLTLIEDISSEIKGPLPLGYSSEIGGFEKYLVPKFIEDVKKMKGISE